MSRYTVVGLIDDNKSYYVNTVTDVDTAKDAADRERSEVEGLLVVAVFNGALQPCTEDGVSDFD